jgi:hypothetical protein
MIKLSELMQKDFEIVYQLLRETQDSYCGSTGIDALSRIRAALEAAIDQKQRNWDAWQNAVDELAKWQHREILNKQKIAEIIAKAVPGAVELDKQLSEVFKLP